MYRISFAFVKAKLIFCMEVHTMPKVNNESIPDTTLPRALLRGLITAVVITFASLFIMALIITYTPVNEAFADTAVSVITYIAIVAGGVSAAKRTAVRGWLTGIISAALYILLMWIVSLAAGDNMHTAASSIVTIVINLLCGTIGGIIGINCRK